MLQENSLLTIYTILFRVLQLGFCAPVPWLRLIHSQFNLLCGFIRYKILQTLLSLSPLLVVKRICFVLCVAIKARKEEEARFWGRERKKIGNYAGKERARKLSYCASLSLRTGELRPRLCCEMFKSSAHLSLSPAPRFWSDRLQVYCEHCSSWAGQQTAAGWGLDRQCGLYRGGLTAPHCPSQYWHSAHHQTAITPCVSSQVPAPEPPPMLWPHTGCRAPHRPGSAPSLSAPPGARDLTR